MSGLLILAVGNPSRGDDALGSLFAEQLEIAREQFGWSDVELFTDFQLQIEHALDLGCRQHVLFVDASLSCTAPFEASRVCAMRDTSFTSHALSPAALLQVYEDLEGTPPPPATLVAIRGEAFELGAPMSPGAQAHLLAALVWGLNWVDVRTGGLPD